MKPSADPRPTGMLHLRAARLGDRTILVETERTAPFHLTAPFDRASDGAAEVIIQQVGPGLFPGDDLRLTTTVEAGARLTVRAQAATKLYPCPSGSESRQRVVLRVMPGGELVVLNGELIPFWDARYRQETTIGLAPGARLALVEVVTPGRLAMGERDRFGLLDLRLRIAVDGDTILIERARLEPRRRSLASLGRHGQFDCAGSLYLAGYGALDVGPDPGDRRVWWGHGRVGEGDVTVVRCLGPTAQAVQAELARLLQRATTGATAALADPVRDTAGAAGDGAWFAARD